MKSETQHWTLTNPLYASQPDNKQAQAATEAYRIITIDIHPRYQSNLVPIPRSHHKQTKPKVTAMQMKIAIHNVSRLKLTTMEADKELSQ
jgi:hypothetical protein